MVLGLSTPSFSMDVRGGEGWDYKFFVLFFVLVFLLLFFCVSYYSLQWFSLDV